MSDTITHPELVAALVKPGNDILAGLTAESADLWHAATGVAGEGTEICLAFLNFAIEGTLDKENLVEELGDMEFYLQQLRVNVGIERDELEGTDAEFLFSPEPVEMGKDRLVACRGERDLRQDASPLGQRQEPLVGMAQPLRVLLAHDDRHLEPGGRLEQEAGAGDDGLGAGNGRGQTGLDVDDEKKAPMTIEQHGRPRPWL